MPLLKQKMSGHLVSGSANWTRLGASRHHIKAVTEDNFNCVLLASYLKGKYPAGKDAELSAAIDEIELRANRRQHSASHGARPERVRAKRAIRLVEDRLIDPSAFEMLRYGPFLPHLPLKYVIQIVELIFDMDPSSNVELALEIIDSSCEINPPPSNNSESRHGKRSRPCRKDASRTLLIGAGDA